MTSAPNTAHRGWGLVAAADADRPVAKASLLDAVGDLRRDVAATEFPLEVPGVDVARARRAALLDQLDDHLLPRLRELSAPGLVVVAVLIILGPTVWVDVLGNESAIFPYAYPTLFSVAAAFVVTIVVSLTDRSDRAVLDREAFAEQVVRAETGGERPIQERYSG